MERDLSSAVVQLAGKSRRFTKGGVILFQGEAPRSAFVVAEGAVRAYAIDDMGNEYVVAFYTAGDIFPLDWLHEQRSAATFYYEALTPVSVLPLDRATYTEHRDEPGIIAYMRHMLTGEMSSGMIRALALQQARAREKIIYLFYYLALRHGKESSTGLYNLGLPLTHQTIASCLGLTRETVATELGHLKRAGVVAYRNKKYIVDKQMVIRTVGKEIASLE